MFSRSINLNRDAVGINFTKSVNKLFIRLYSYLNEGGIMKKFSLSFVSDCIFIAFAGFILALFIMNYFMPAPYKFIAAGTFAALLTLLGVKVLYGKRKNKYTKSCDDAEYSRFILQMQLMTDAERAACIMKVAERTGEAVQKKKDYFYFPDKKTVLILRFGFTETTKADIVKAFNLVYEKGEAIIASEKFNAETENFAKRFGGKIKLADGKKLFAVLKAADALPPEKYNIDAPNDKRRALINLLDKKRAKNYFVFGVIFLAMSYFVPIKIYYVICGSIMLIMALTLKFFGKTEKGA